MSVGRAVAVIPARGGSKGLPGKNIRELNGRPLIDYVIKAALESNVDEVWVSTDCDAIESVALDSGASVLKRPEALSTDSSPTEEAYLHFASCVPNFDQLVMLQCTSPLTLPEDVDGALSLYRDHNYDSVISVCDAVGGFHCGGYNWEVVGTGGYFRTSKYYPCRQDSPKKYRENGAVYVTSKFILEESKKRAGGRVNCYVMPKHRSFEIDYLHEFEELEFLISSGFIDHMNEKRSAS